MAKFNKPKKFTKENIKVTPKNKSIIYKIKNKDNQNIYTGIAGRGRVVQRLLEHKELKKEKILGANKFQIAQVKNKKVAERIEKQIVKKERPKFNKQNK